MSAATARKWQHRRPSGSKLDPYKPAIDRIVEADAGLRQPRSVRAIREELGITDISEGTAAAYVSQRRRELRRDGSLSREDGRPQAASPVTLVQGEEQAGEPGQCGTYGGVQRHRRLKEPACEPCKAAGREYMGGYRSRKGPGSDRWWNRTRSAALERLAAEYPERFEELLAELRSEAETPWDAATTDSRPA